MNTPVRIAAGVLAFGLTASAASAQACACSVRHHHYARAVRHVAPVRYERRVVREPVYVGAYDSGYYDSGYYGSGYYGSANYGGGYAQPYGYAVVRPAYSYWRSRPVVVSYGETDYWRHHRHHDWDDGWRHGDHGRHRGWDHDRGHWGD